MTAGEFKAKARKLANGKGMKGAKIWAFGEDPSDPETAGIRHDNLELTFARPLSPATETVAYSIILQGIR